MTKPTVEPKKRHPKEVKVENKVKRRRAPGKTIESRENQLISAAVELAAKQIRSGTASSQVITHFLKLGSTTAALEKVKLENENLLLKAKTEQLQSQKRIEDLYANALSAMRNYSGQSVEEESDD
jgi:hypothetical protein